MGHLLVLGGTSWLGGEVARSALARDHEVTCLARGESGDVPAGASLIVADRSEPGAYDAVIDRRWDAVIDVARQPGHVRSALAALGGTTTQWTFVSTGSVYADQSGPLTEGSPLLPAVETDEVGPEEYGEGKVACEEAVAEHPRSLIVRVGLIGGPGDGSDRFGYYVGRHALAGAEPVLVPDVADQPMQVIDVRDLATWLVTVACARESGVVHGAGEPTTVGHLLELSARASGATGHQVARSPEELEAAGVQAWMGERSLPLWLPASHHGMGLMDDTRALGLGLRRRPLAETLADVLADERERGLDRPRRAGLTRSEELELLGGRLET